MQERNLIIVHRGPEYQRDFDEIAQKVNALDPNISVYHLPSELDADLPVSSWAHPTLTVALTPDFRIPVRRGPILRNRTIDKLDQLEIFRNNGIPSPPALPFRFGMPLDPIMFGDFVVLKTRDLTQTSKGDAVHLYRRKSLMKMGPADFPPDHPIHRSGNGYIVQRFVDTGEYPSYNRVQTFLGKPIYAWNNRLGFQRASLDASDAELARTKITLQGEGLKFRTLIKEPDILALAEKVHAALPQIPMLAIDIIRDCKSGRLSVLECNPGGNTWHFSSDIGKRIRLGFGQAEINGEAAAHEIARRMLIDHMGAFDIVAERLARATQELAA